MVNYILVSKVNGLPVYLRGRQPQMYTFDIDKAVRIREDDIDTLIKTVKTPSSNHSWEKVVDIQKQ